MKSFLALASASLLLAACSDGVETQSDGGLAVGDAVPAFSAVDVNATSATFEATLTEKDFSGRVAGYYFGHAT